MSWQHFRDTKPKAAKPHKCFLCERPIACGELHVYRTGLLDGKLHAQRMHVNCEAMTREWDQTDWATFDSEGFRDMVDCLLAALVAGLEKKNEEDRQRALALSLEQQHSEGSSGSIVEGYP